MRSAIEARGLFRVYSAPEGDAAALQGLDLTVREGEVLVVLGPSGSGKTTLLRLLAGLDRPSAGTLRVLGLELPTLSARRLAGYRSRMLGYVDQHYARALAPELPARELAGLRLELLGATRAERRERAERLLERVGLAGCEDARPHELSGGEQQRLAVCAALAHQPRLLLADEPTGELDAASATQVYRLLGEVVREQRCTAVIVSHDPESAEIADRVVWIRDGRVSEERAAERAGSEAIVVGRGGWLRLPEELLLRAGIGERATAGLAPGGVLVARAEAGGPPPERAAEPGPARAHAAGVVAEVRSLGKTFASGRRATAVLGGLSATFRAGRLVAVTGPSGSGKTTLLHLLAGLEQATEGEVAIDGLLLSPLDRDARARLRRERIGLVRQEPGLVPFLSARENVELSLRLRGLAGPAASERALEALAAVGLGERGEHWAARLSAGERQRAAIARAVAGGPRLLLADEPTARLDQRNAVEIGALLSRLAHERGLAVVCATHDPLVIAQADEELALAGRPAARPRAGRPG
jgi:ABC-type lipoprotein export system ATPase subunit